MIHFLNFESAETKGEQFLQDCEENSKYPKIKNTTLFFEKETLRSRTTSALHIKISVISEMCT